MESKAIREIYKDNFAEYLLCLALDVGEGMLKNGAEISRVEDTIERICRAYGAVHVEVFTIISVINAALRMPDGSYSTQIRRVKSTGTNLTVLERLNALSREICTKRIPLDDFDARLHGIKKEKTYPAWVITLAYAVVSFGFAFFFGGNFLDAVIAALAGVLVSFIDFLPSKRLNSMAKTVISSFVIAIVAGLGVIIGVGNDGGAIIMGTIMLLVPGVSFGTAMRDLLCGDLIAGTLKTLQAVLSALMIAFGYMLAYVVLGGAAI